MNKKLLIPLFSLVCFLCVSFTVRAAGTVEEITISDTGEVELWGTVENYTDNTQVTILMSAGKFLGDDATDSNIMYIDQEAVGNNGVFYFDYQVQEQFVGQPYNIYIGSNAEGFELLTLEGTIPDLPNKVYQVNNNAIRIGRDAYDLDCLDYTPDNISKSIEEGGNIICYKIGGLWFDLLNENATSWEYFAAENALDEAVWSQWYIRNYYTDTGLEALMEVQNE
ncbi:MAG: hypothetical protein IJ300_06990 [Clostridia bacterium]|nr:hypothetical protein [Clostridia bacterium]